MTMKSLLFGIVSFFSFSGLTFAQEINRLDHEGKRHGPWKKYYDNSRQIRYEGNFKHGKEVGVFKFYKPEDKKNPSLTKTFNEKNDSVLYQFYSKKGNLRSRGMMVNERREGKWNYYKGGKTDQPVMVEHYLQDQLDGWKIIYYPDGKKAEKTHYKAGVKDGEHILYSEFGNVLQQYEYRKGKLHGKTLAYDGAGKILSEGFYKQGHKNGEWKFYTNGKLDSIQKYPLPDRRKKVKVKN